MEPIGYKNIFEDWYLVDEPLPSNMAEIVIPPMYPLYAPIEDES